MVTGLRRLQSSFHINLATIDVDRIFSAGRAGLAVLKGMLFREEVKLCPENIFSCFV